MKGIDWVEFKNISEKKFKTSTLENCWGFQIQRDTKWNTGLNDTQILGLEQHWGLGFPKDYVEMLKNINGFATEHISIDPDGKEEDQFERRCYQYPEDIEKTKWLIEEINEHFTTAKKVLEEGGFNSEQIEGFIPLYGHRVLVVLGNKEKSPVLSVWGNDIILYGQSLLEYWCSEFNIPL